MIEKFANGNRRKDKNGVLSGPCEVLVKYESNRDGSVECEFSVLKSIRATERGGGLLQEHRHTEDSCTGLVSCL
jgi:hypothetical protein